MSTRIVYTDLDGTMVGPRGSFWHTVNRDLTDDPATALLELHRAGIRWCWSAAGPSSR